MDLNKNNKKTPLQTTPILNSLLNDNNNSLQSVPSGDLEEDIKILYNTISQVNRKLEYWDLYHINYIANDEAQFLGIAATLPIGESVLNNSDTSFNYNGIQVMRGGVLVHTMDDTKEYIAPNEAGHYYPEINTNTGGQLTLTYKYDEHNDHTDPLSVIVPTIADNSNYYGLWTEVDSIDNHSFYTGLDFYNDKSPLIRFFQWNASDNSYEEVIVDYSYFNENNKIIIYFYQDELPENLYVLIK